LKPVIASQQTCENKLAEMLLGPFGKISDRVGELELAVFGENEK
jgi:hypothetical protein